MRRQCENPSCSGNGPSGGHCNKCDGPLFEAADYSTDNPSAALIVGLIVVALVIAAGIWWATGL